MRSNYRQKRPSSLTCCRRRLRTFIARALRDGRTCTLSVVPRLGGVYSPLLVRVAWGRARCGRSQAPNDAAPAPAATTVIVAGVILI
jgi:hypothetical protein